MNIYLVTEKTIGPAGHGMPGAKLKALATTEAFSNDLMPAFMSREAAEEALCARDSMSFFEVTELEIK